MRSSALSAGFLVADQLAPGDVDALAIEGVRRILCLRPDDEDGDYAPAVAIAEAARTRGLRFECAPVRGLDVNPTALAAVADALDDPGPVLAYCRSGRRVALAWALVQAQRGEDLEAILAASAAAGHDLSGSRAELVAAQPGP